MLWTVVIVLSFLCHASSGLDKTFPSFFKFGAASSSYQIEGGWNASDKSESIYDRMMHSHPELVAGGVTGDVTCDSYHNWRRDVEMVHEMGLNFYRFSISWTRLLPNAFPTKISPSGKKYYNDLIDYLLEKGIEPIVTLYHWELPQKLQDLGGWTNPLISEWFADYAGVVYTLFADRVKTWITINEPNMMCDYSYNSGLMAPNILEPEMAGLLCNKHVLVAHAKAWRIYDEKYKPMYHGKMTIGNHLMWIIPKTADDEEVAELAFQSCNGLYTHPIYSKKGGWPPLVEKAIAEFSKKMGYPRSKLPAFTKQEISLVRGTHDYFGLNYYTARLARRAEPGEKPGPWFFFGHPDFNIMMDVDPTWPIAGHHLSPSYPEGLRKIIAWLREQYGDLEFFITENGCGDPNPHDHVRIQYIRTHLEKILVTIKEDGANITGYTYWSLMDNLEWMFGFDVKFGLYSVDFEDPLRTRSPRASAHYYSRIATTRSLDVPVPTAPQRTHKLHQTHKPHHRTTNNTTNNANVAHYIPVLMLVHFYIVSIYS